MAYDEDSGKEVAWNTVNLSSTMTPREQARIRSEAKILAELTHHRIIKIYDVWEVPEQHKICFVTERITSGSLREYTRSRKVKLKVIKRYIHAWCEL